MVVSATASIMTRTLKTIFKAAGLSLADDVPTPNDDWFNKPRVICFLYLAIAAWDLIFATRRILLDDNRLRWGCTQLPARRVGIF